MTLEFGERKSGVGTIIVGSGSAVSSSLVIEGSGSGSEVIKGVIVPGSEVMVGGSGSNMDVGGKEGSEVEGSIIVVGSMMAGSVGDSTIKLLSLVTAAVVTMLGITIPPSVVAEEETIRLVSGRLGDGATGGTSEGSVGMYVLLLSSDDEEREPMLVKGV